MRIPGSALIVVFTVSATSLAATTHASPLRPPADRQTAAPRQPPATPLQGTSQPPAVPVPASPGQVTAAVPLPAGRVFASEAGVIFSPIRPDKVVDFEIVLGRIHEALARSTDTVRRQQAAGWKVFKALEPGPNGSVLYVFVMDPAVKGADYTISKILSEAFPAEVQEIYKLYNGAFVGGQSLLNLQTLENFAEPFSARPAAAPAKPR